MGVATRDAPYRLAQGLTHAYQKGDSVAEKNETTTGAGWDSVDKPVFIIAGVCCLLVIFATLVFPSQAAKVIADMFSGMTTNFGWFYMLLMAAFVGFSLFLAFSRYGKIKLGKDDDEPEFSFTSWFFMLFSAGMGIGLVFYSVAAPMSFFIQPPTAEPGTIQAAKDAMHYTFLHWGLHPWAAYVVVGAGLGYFQHRLGKPALLSSVFVPLFGEKACNGLFGKVVDALAVIVTVFGVTTSLGMGAIQISGGLGFEFGLPSGIPTMLAVVVIATIIYTIASVSGVDKGINLCATVNLWIMIGVMVFLFIAGNTTFIMDYFTESVGNYLSSIVKDSFWVDAFSQTDGWVDTWTIFFWAWWIAWAPFVGGFIARISKGRTIREFVVGALIFPSILSFFFMTVMGGNAIDLTLNGGVTAISEAVSKDISLGLFAMLNQMPLSGLLSVLSMVLLLVFFITSANGATLVCSMMTSHGMQNPPKRIIIFWSIVLGATAAGLLLAGGLSSVQTISVIGAFPFGFICLGVIIAVIKALKNEFDPASGEKHTLEETMAVDEGWYNDSHPAVAEERSA